ncbi:hypothetical protein FHL15_003452 [Xylaria flabelliformis]|uniref:Uncharacterized protein n=1 Tax=Xylaria flabelliformis TaxID=2512241 RepID=A0A553I5Q8_9PEZI|nr:hypothetical protein FHL15_003452 [Xylaria flabelliformis]
MTEEQDKILKSWKADKGKDKGMVESNYRSLCSSLFGNGIGVPTNIPEYKINPESARLGERNEEYFMRCRVAAQPGSTAGFPQQPSPSPHQYHLKNPLSLDEPPQPNDWTVQKTAHDQDSGYGSKPSTETAPLANNGAYNNPNWRYDPSWYHPNDNEVAYTTFFDEMLNYPPSVDIETGDQSWELGNSDGQVS